MVYVCGVIILARLFSLQIVNGASYRETSNTRISRETTIEATRGNILDRNGTVLVSDVRDGIFIKTKEGILKVLEIQGENARRMTIQEYLRGNSIQEFDVFE